MGELFTLVDPTRDWMLLFDACILQNTPLGVGRSMLVLISKDHPTGSLNVTRTPGRNDSVSNKMILHLGHQQARQLPTDYRHLKHATD
jgi:hypothetical protein